MEQGQHVEPVLVEINPERNKYVNPTVVINGLGANPRVNEKFINHFVSSNQAGVE